MATNTMTDGLRAYIEGCSDDMVNQILGALQQAGRSTVYSAAPSMPVVESPAAKVEKKQRKKAKAGRPGGGPKRPLNSWMAFRNFYTPMLAPHTQKVASKVLTKFWQADPSEGKWAILAKAYSTVRGCREKSEAPLAEFLALCAPLIGVIPPEEYLQWMGWQLGPPQEGDQEKMPQVIRLFTPDFGAFPEKFTTTTLSVDDLVCHCYAVGYADASNDDSPDASTQGSLTMVSKPTAITTDDMNEATHMAPFAQTNTTPAFNAATSSFSSSMGEEAQFTPLGDLVNSPSSPTNDADPSPFEFAPVAPPAAMVTLGQAATQLEESGAEYPYWEACDPSIDLIGTSYDPADLNIAVEDGGRWDAVDLNMWAAQANVAPASAEPVVGLSWAEFINDEVMN